MLHCRKKRVSTHFQNSHRFVHSPAGLAQTYSDKYSDNSRRSP